MIKRFLPPTLVLCFGLLLGSCSPGSVADHWPRWAGGMPDDVPPRPGAPGYDEFIAHKGAAKDAAATGAASAEKANPQGTPSGTPPRSDPVQGGLY